jgi:two-component system, LuxR family, response regulator FixJ
MTSRRPILLVDDDIAVLQSLSFWLETEGFEVTRFPDAEGVLTATVPERSLLILDHRLPGLNGLELLEQLRAIFPRLPAILITTHPDAKLRHAAAEVGVRIVEKPLSGDDLLDAIRFVSREVEEQVRH